MYTPSEWVTIIEKNPMLFRPSDYLMPPTLTPTRGSTTNCAFTVALFLLCSRMQANTRIHMKYWSVSVFHQNCYFNPQVHPPYKAGRTSIHTIAVPRQRRWDFMHGKTTMLLHAVLIGLLRIRWGRRVINSGWRIIALMRDFLQVAWYRSINLPTCNSVVFTHWPHMMARRTAYWIKYGLLYYLL